MNLRHFIQQHGGEIPPADDDSVTQDSSVPDPSFYYLSNKSGDGNLGMEHKKLQRIPTCAVFHKVAEGKGVPHTFIGAV